MPGANAAVPQGFPRDIDFVYPWKTVPVSLTGANCELNCAHCGGHYLKGMRKLDEVLAGPLPAVKSYLVSGGFTNRGTISLEKHEKKLAALSLLGPLNLHPGLVDEADARKIGSLVEVVSFDFVLDADVIQHVYGLQREPHDFLHAYRLLRKHVRVIPHLCLGLSGAQLREEYRALQILRKEGADAISLLVFRPTPGTRLAHFPPPLLEEVERFMRQARRLFPEIPLYLGCLRPGGLYRQALDCIALQAGVNKIVQPAPPARKMAAEMQLNIRYSEECCAF